MSEWKPGDVALVECSDGEWRLAFYNRHTFGLYWRFADGMCRDADQSNARPVAVIDPEEDAAVDSVADAIRDHHGRNNTKVWVGIDWLATQAALRALADPKPPKPDEPTGLGAVVEDSNGDYWCYTGDRDIDDVRWWLHGAINKRKYDAIPAVRVLSEGVTP